MTRAQLPDPGTPSYEAARSSVVAVLKEIGRVDRRNGYSAMAADLAKGDLMQLPTWLVLGMLAKAVQFDAVGE